MTRAEARRAARASRTDRTPRITRLYAYAHDHATAEYTLAEALSLPEVGLRDDDIILHVGVGTENELIKGVCRVAELLEAADELGDGLKFRIGVAPTAEPSLGAAYALYLLDGKKRLVYQGRDVPYITVFRRASFDALYGLFAEAGTRPQRLIPVVQEAGHLGFMGAAGVGYVGETLDETLAWGDTVRV